MNKTFKLFKSQTKVLNSTSEIILLLAGRGLGKSTVASHWVLKQLANSPHVLGFVGTPSHAQTNDLVGKIANLFADLQLPYVIGRQPPKDWGSNLVDHKAFLSVMLPGQKRCSQIRYGSLDNYESHRGISIGWQVIDEAALVKEIAYREVLLPALRGYGSAHQYQQLLLTTPKGISNWISDMESFDNVQVIRGASAENFIEFPNEKIEIFKSLMSDRQFRQEILGEVINVSSRSQYHGFSTKCLDNKNLDQFKWAIASDQNIDPAIAMVIKYNKDIVQVYDEIYIEGGATVNDICNELIKKDYLKKQIIYLFGDSFGNNRNHVVDTSYYKQMTSRLESAGIKVINKTLRKNPPIYESRECVNNLFEKDKLYINSRCKHTILDLERAQYTEDFKTDKKSYDPHLADALAYMVWKEFGSGGGTKIMKDLWFK